VIASDEGDAVGITDFERKEKEEGLDGVEATVDKVTYGRSADIHNEIDV
jgi:hypothetical protein